MSINYSAINGFKQRVTAPSVEAWSSNKNILRDPPKSVFTRRIDKVNQDGSLNEMFYHSGDRFAEYINVYARGVNPSVSTSYGNNQSASMQGTPSANGGHIGSKLPYRIMNAGSFRPPQLRQEQLLPLSRQPRNVTKVITNKEFKDYTKSATCDSQPKRYRQIVEDKIERFIAPTKTMKIQMPVQEHFAVSYVITNPLKGSYQTNLKSIKEEHDEDVNIYLQRNLPQYEMQSNKNENISSYIAPDKEITLNRNNPMYEVQSNKNENISSYVSPDRDIQLDRNNPMYEVQSNKNEHISSYVSPDRDFELDNNLPQYAIQTNKGENTATNGVWNDEINLDMKQPRYMRESVKSNSAKHVHFSPDNEYNFDNNMPSTDAYTNKSESIFVDGPTRSYNRLGEALHPGEFKGVPTMPMPDRNIQYNSNYQTTKTMIAQRMMDERDGRD